MKAVEFVSTVFVGIVLLAGSCASPSMGAYVDPAENFPIAVEPQLNETQFTAPAPSAGLNPADATRFGQVVAGFLETGRGSISVSVPDTANASDIIGYFGEKLVSLGVPRARILVGTYTPENAQADGLAVKVSYLRYQPKMRDCVNGSENLTNTYDNKPMANFGCSTQRNIAVQVSDPSDLTTPRSQDARDSSRRTDAVKKYEKGGIAKESTPKISNIGN